MGLDTFCLTQRETDRQLSGLTNNDCCQLSDNSLILLSGSGFFRYRIQKTFVFSATLNRTTMCVFV